MLKIIDIPDRIHIRQPRSKQEQMALRLARRKLAAIWRNPIHDHKAEAEALAEIRRLIRA